MRATDQWNHTQFIHDDVNFGICEPYLL